MSQWSGCQIRYRWFNVNFCNNEIRILFGACTSDLITIFLFFSISGTEIEETFRGMPFHNSYYAKYIFLSNLFIYWTIDCYCITHSMKFTKQQWTMKYPATRFKSICIYSFLLRSPIFDELLNNITFCFYSLYLILSHLQ